MSRRSLFIATVFLAACAALLLVGHLRAPGPNPRSREAGAARQEDNLVTIPLWDPKRGTRFLLRAVLRDDSVFIFGQTAEEQTIGFGKGQVTVPFDLPGEAARPEGATSGGTLHLEFQEAVYRGLPGLSQSAKISFPAPCTGTLGDGRSHTTAHFRSLEVNWRGASLMNLRSEEPVTITRDKPELILRAPRGVEGRFSSSDKEHVLRFPAPVQAWITRTAGQALLSLSPAPSTTQRQGYLCVRCRGDRGGLLLDWGQNRIVFDQNVTICSTTAIEVPAKPSPRRFECHRLVLSLDPKTTRITQAVAERGPAVKVRGYWDAITIEGGKATWKAETETAVLSSSPHLWGTAKHLRFDAESETIHFDTGAHRATLLGPIKCNIEHTAGTEKLSLPPFWIVSADLGEVLFDEKGGHQIREIVASADPTVPSQLGVRIESLPQAAIVATGGKLIYRVPNQSIEVTGLPGHPPYLEMKGNRETSGKLSEKGLLEFTFAAWPQRVRFAFQEDCIYLEDRVKAKVTRNTTKWGELTDRLKAEKVKMKHHNKGDVVVEAWGQDPERPLVLDYEGPPRVRLEGGHLVWQRASETASVLPFEQISRQTISFLSGRLSAHELRFVPRAKEAQASAHGRVEVLLQTQQGPLKLHADNAELTVDTQRVPAEGPPGLNAVRRVVVWCEGENRILLQHRKLKGEAGKITYDAQEETLLLAGSGHQVFHFLGPSGSDQLKARVVKFVPKENRLALSGDVQGLIYQRNWGAAPQALHNQEPPQTPWHYTAEAADVQLDQIDGRLRPGRLSATGSVRLTNQQLGIAVTGDRLTFDPATRTIVLREDASKSALQTIRYGVPPRESLLSGRKIVLTRRERLKEGETTAEIVAVITGDARCLFWLRQLPHVKEIPKFAPEKLVVTANRILFVLPLEDRATQGLFSYAHAQRNVMFQGYAQEGTSQAKGALCQGFGAEAYYVGGPTMVFTILGDGKSVKARATTPVGDVTAQWIELSQRQDKSLRVRKGEGVEYRPPSPLEGLREFQPARRNHEEP